MVKYKTPENIPFKYNPFKKHPPKLGVSYSIMLGCWFGGMRMGLRRAWGDRRRPTRSRYLIMV